MTQQAPLPPPSLQSSHPSASTTAMAPSGSAMVAWLRIAFWKKPLHLLDSEHASLHHHPHRHSPEHAAASNTSRSSSSSSSSDADDEGSGDHDMARTLGLFDLIMIGIGGTVGSGVFATAGLIASVYAGPAAVLSWLIAGAGCILSGFSFMELSCRIPSTGSTYAYAYHALGELPAMFAGFLLTLEYGVSSAGGARSWSDKFTNWLATELEIEGPAWMKPQDSTIDLYAGLLLSLCVAVVLCGMQAGKTLVNVVTMTKISVVLFIIVVGLLQFDAANVTPFVPPAETNSAGHVVFGWPGVFLGASASFFGYIGYDEVCCLAGEAKHPTRNIPRAVLGTIVGAAVLSTLATLALVGMQRHTLIDASESFGKAFEHAGWPWAATIVTTGEVLTMPITTFIGFLAQPRVQYAMAKDGLLPSVFARVDAHGNLFAGTLVSGVAITLIAVCVPFHVLWSFISLGILVAFNLTNASLLLVRGAELESQSPQPSSSSSSSSHRHARLLVAFLVTSFIAAVHWQKSVIAFVPLTGDAQYDSVLDAYMAAVGAPVALVFTVFAVASMCGLKYVEATATSSGNGGSLSHDEASEDKSTAATATTATTKKKKRTSGASQDVELSATALSLQRLDDDQSSVHLRVRARGDDGDAQDEAQQLEAGQPVKPTKTVSGTADDLETTKATRSAAANTNTASDDDEDDDAAPSAVAFRAPLVPFAPCVAIFFNWFLFAQMDASSVLLIALWLLLALGVYVTYSRHHSLAHQQTSYHRVSSTATA